MHPEHSHPKPFHAPQRQSTLGILVESAFGLQNFIKVIWPVLIYFFLKDNISPLITGLAIIILLLFYILYGFLKYKNFIFYIDDDTNEFILETGIFNKKKVMVKLDRIQQVNINQGFIQKLLGVFAVEINTAGTAKSEVKIKAVSRAIASQLKDRLLDAIDSKPADAAAPGRSSKAYLHLSMGTLAKIAITSNYGKSFGVIIAIIATLYNALRDLFPGSEEAMESIYNTFHFTSILPYLGISILAAFVFLFVFNFIRVLITYSNYQIQLKRSAFSISYGLLQTKNILLYSRKVQVAKTVTNFFQRKMNLCRVFFHQASSDISHDAQSVIQVPGCTFRQKDELFYQVFENLGPEKVTLKPNWRKVISGIIFLIILPLIIGVWSFHKDWFSIYASILPFWLLSVALLLWFQFKNSRLFAGDGFVSVAGGAWDVSKSILETYKIQAITVRQRLWHRRASIGHVIIHTAGGRVSFRYGDFNKINSLVNQWLADVETSERVWM